MLLLTAIYIDLSTGENNYFNSSECEDINSYHQNL